MRVEAPTKVKHLPLRMRLANTIQTSPCKLPSRVSKLILGHLHGWNRMTVLSLKQLRIFLINLNMKRTKISNRDQSVPFGIITTTIATTLGTNRCHPHFPSPNSRFYGACCSKMNKSALGIAPLGRKDWCEHLWPDPPRHITT